MGIKRDTKLSPHFTFREFLVSQTATRKNIENKPSSNDVENLKVLALRLEEIRTLVGEKPIVVTSGYRSSKLNKEIGGAKHSAQIDGRAADIICPQFGLPKKLFKAIKESDIKFDQLIDEFEDWVHFAIAKHNRKQILIATKRRGNVNYERIT